MAHLTRRKYAAAQRVINTAKLLGNARAFNSSSGRAGAPTRASEGGTTTESMWTNAIPFVVAGTQGVPEGLSLHLVAKPHANRR